MSSFALGTPDMEPSASQIKISQGKSMSPLQLGLPNSKWAETPLPDISPQTRHSPKRTLDLCGP